MNEIEVFPAPAGVILMLLHFIVCRLGFPRTCGGDPYRCSVGGGYAPFSPHLRG